MSGGLGNDPHARRFVAAERAKFHEMYARLVGIEQPEVPAIRIAFEGYLSFMEGATLDWLTHRDIPRSALRELILSAAPLVRHAATETLSRIEAAQATSPT